MTLLKVSVLEERFWQSTFLWGASEKPPLSNNYSLLYNLQASTWAWQFTKLAINPIVKLCPVFMHYLEEPALRVTCYVLALNTPPRQFTLPRHQPITLKNDIDYAEHLFNVLTEIRQHKIPSGGEEYRAWCSLNFFKRQVVIFFTWALIP